jgi:hypothetical protein
MSRRKRQSGSAAVEFALAFTMIWFFFAGLFQYG